VEVLRGERSDEPGTPDEVAFAIEVAIDGVARRVGLILVSSVIWSIPRFHGPNLMGEVTGLRLLCRFCE